MIVGNGGARERESVCVWGGERKEVRRRSGQSEVNFYTVRVSYFQVVNSAIPQSYGKDTRKPHALATKILYPLLLDSLLLWGGVCMGSESKLFAFSQYSEHRAKNPKKPLPSFRLLNGSVLLFLTFSLPWV